MEQLLPVMLLKGLILLPNQEVKIELSNNISKEIIKLASKKYNRKVLVITPHNQIEESPEVQDLPDVGVIGKIKSKIELPNGNIRITLKGETRVKIVMFSNNTENEDILEASITDIKLPKFDEVEEIETGINKDPSFYLMLKICDTLQISIFSLLSEEGYESFILNKLT